MQNDHYHLELCSKTCCVFGTDLAASLTNQIDSFNTNYNTQFKSLPYTAAGWEYSKSFDLSIERRIWHNKRKPEANQEQH